MENTEGKVMVCAINSRKFGKALGNKAIGRKVINAVSGTNKGI